MMTRFPTFQIVGVTASDVVAPFQHISGFHASADSQHGGLVGYLGLYGLLPQLLFQWQRGIQLLAETLVLQGVSVKWKQKARGQVAVVARDDGAIVV